MELDFAETIYSWWLNLLVSHNHHFESARQAMTSDFETAISLNNGIVCLKDSHPLRYYFFGARQKTADNPDNQRFFLYAFVPEITHVIRPELKELFSEELGFMLNSPLAQDTEFAERFTLPVRVSHDAAGFEGRNYQGIAVKTKMNNNHLDGAALDCWKKKVFSPFCRFLNDATVDYFTKKGE